MNNIKVGVIGTGLMGEYHVRLYSKMSNVELVGISDIDSDRVNELSSKYKCIGFNNYRELLSQKDKDGNGIDAVSICVPTILHKEISIEAMKLGIKHLLIEKPISDSIENATSIIEFAKKTNSMLMIGHVERFNPSVIELKKLIDSKKIGVIVSISAKRVGPHPPRIKDAGIIIDLSIHDIDVISYLFGKYPTYVYAIDGHNKESSEILLGRVGFEDRVTIMMKFDDGKVGIVESNWLTPHKIRKLYVVGLEGVATLDYIDQTIEISTKERTEDIKFTKEEPLLNELNHFINCVIYKNTPFITGNSGLNALKVALAAKESHKTNDVIKM